MKKQVYSMVHALIASSLLAGIGSPAISQDQEVSEADRAYVAPVTAEPDLPALPPTPILSQDGYPDCREDFQKIAAPFDKAEDTNRCTILLDRYYAEVLTPFRQRMIDHQNEISGIYTSKVAGKMEYSAKSRDDFYAAMMAEHAASDPDGAHLETYRTLEARYQQDRAYLQDRFCFNTGCGGYSVPEYVAVEEKPDKGTKSKSAGKSKGPHKCKKAKKRGGVLGGLLGGVAGNAAGLGKIGTLISSAAGAVLVGEIACQLTEDEQKEAIAATVEVTEKEEVGATATWKSPTRAGVSGSSTVTALNTEPNGRKCLNITDVAIIDGQETRVSKQMCRGQGDEGYTILA
jgi:surface antigen